MLSSAAVMAIPRRRLLLTFILLTAAIAVTLSLDGRVAATGPSTERISVSSAGVQGNSDSDQEVISADGRYVAFHSLASTLVPSDTNGVDCFVHDRVLSATERVSLTNSGAQSIGGCDQPSLSADGRYVAFHSSANDLVSGDGNNKVDIFVRDRVLSATERVSVSSAGAEGDNHSYVASISADGRYVAFYSSATNLVAGDSNGVIDIFVRDRTLNTTERVSRSSSGVQGNSQSYNPSISADGRYVAFMSYATNLDSALSDTNNMRDIFVRDRTAGATERVSVTTGGAEANSDSYWPSISADGRYVAFESDATNLAPGDTNLRKDIFVHDRVADTTERVSVSGAGAESDGDSNLPSLSADGRYVAFWSNGTNLVISDTNSRSDVFVRDRTLGATERISVSSAGAQGSSWSYSYNPSISADGRYVAFESDATNLVAGDTNSRRDVFVRDRLGDDAATPTPSPTPIATALPTETPTPTATAAATATPPGSATQTPTPTATCATGDAITERVSVSSDESEANSGSEHTHMSADGRYVAFHTDATNLVPSDTNAAADIFVRDRVTGVTERVSIAPDGAQGNNDSYWPSISADGRYVVFESWATNLAAGDTNAFQDIFLHDRTLGATERVSIASGGAVANGHSYFAVVSADGRYVAFYSYATNLVPSDTNGVADVFVHDRNTSTTERISVSSAGAQASSGSYSPQISADGRYVVFESQASNLVAGDTGGYQDIFVHDRMLDTTERVSIASDGAAAGNWSFGPSISADGRYVAFYSYATNIVASDTNGFLDIFVRDRVLSSTERVSVSSTGTEANNGSYTPQLSTDGRYVVFYSYASNLVEADTNFKSDVFIRDRLLDSTERVSVSSAGVQANDASFDYGVGVSADGRYVAFTSHASNLVASDTNGVSDVFVRDRTGEPCATETPTPSPTGTPSEVATPTPTGTPVEMPTPSPTETPTPTGTCIPTDATTERVSVSSAEIEGNDNSSYPSISTDGRYVAFDSTATNLVAGDTNGYMDVFVRDRVTGAAERVSVSTVGIQGDNPSYWPSISADGRYVAFNSTATTMVPGDSNTSGDVFVRDRVTGATERVSVSTAGVQGDFDSYWCNISADGRYVAFTSYATNLVASDTNGTFDVFVRDRVLSATERVSISTAGAQGNDDSYGPSISADGRYVAFHSEATNLVPSDTNGTFDVFVRDRVTGATERVSVSTAGAQATGGSSHVSSISADGRYVAFYSEATNLVAGDSNASGDIFVRDRLLSATERVSVASDGFEANGESERPIISADGRYVAFDSEATNLVASDTNGTFDVFVRDRVLSDTERVSVSTAGAEADGNSHAPSVSADGRYIAFDSFATNLVADDNNDSRDVFLRDRGVPCATASPTPTGTPVEMPTPSPTETPTPTWTPWPTPTPSPTATPMWVVTGAVNLQGRSNDGGATVSMNGYTATTVASGVYTIGEPFTGQYDVTASMAGYLYAQRNEVMIYGGMDQSLPPVTLLGGDVNGDNIVSIYDLVAVGASFGSPSATADITGDGVVNVFDLALVGANFGRSAPTEW